MSSQECADQFASEIMFFDIFPWVALAVGVVGFVIVFYTVFHKRNIDVIMVVFFLVIVIFSAIGITGVVPSLNGSITQPSLGNISARSNPKYYCTTLKASASVPTDSAVPINPTVPDDATVPADVTVPADPTPDKIIPIQPATVTNMAPIKGRLTWIFYGEGYGTDAAAVAKAIEGAGGISNPPTFDSFAAVKFKWKPGDIRVVFATEYDKAQADAIGDYLKKSFPERKVIVNGPYPTVDKKPVQVHFY